MKSRSIAIVIVVVVVLVVAAVIAAVLIKHVRRPKPPAPKDEETPATRTYADDRYGYEFQYPGAWAVTVRDVPDGKVVMVGPEGVGGQAVPVVYIFRADLSQGQTPSAFLEMKLKALADLKEDVGDFEVVSRGAVQAAGRECPQATCKFRDLKADRAKKKVREVVIPYETGVLSFRLIAEEGRFGEYERVFDDLLASLKFAVSG